MAFPTITLDTLWHIGTLERADKRAGSLEGAGISVSLHPDAWEQIARLGGNPWWILTRPNATFLDAHAMNDDQRVEVISWATSAGLCVPVTGYQVTWWDDEYDEERGFLLESFDEACAEADEYDTQPVPIPSFAPTGLLQHRSGWGTRIDLPCVADLVLALYAADNDGFDGVWWDDHLDPSGLSAPRGVIPDGSLPKRSAIRIR